MFNDNIYFNDYSSLKYNKYDKLNIILESSNTKMPYFINNKLNPEFFKQIKNNISFKPVGLWFSCGVDWFNWCMYNMPELVIKKKVYNLYFDDLKLLHIKNMNDLKKFNKEYSVKYYYDEVSETKKNKKTKKKLIKKKKYYTLIKWSEVEKKYSGIKCCPYLMNSIRKLKNYDEYMWYEMLDAASGCIWDTDCIKKIVLGGYIPKYNYDDKKIKTKFENIIDKF